MPSVDPNWLPSTLAQATAALVAIVGGFLVSRLVSLSGERNALASRRAQLLERLRLARAEFNRVHDERREISIEWFEEHHLDDFVQARGQADIEQAIAEFTPRGSNREEMLPVAENLSGRIRAAWQRIDVGYGEGEFPSAKISHLRSKLGSIPDGDENIYERVGSEIADERRSKLGLRTRAVSLALSAFRTTSPITYQRQDARIAKEQELRAEVEVLTSEVRLLADQSQGLAKPEGMFAGMLVLTAFAIVGIAFPMVVMSLRPVPSSGTVRASMVIAFSLGFAGLITYIAVYVRKLRFDDPSASDLDLD